MIGGTPPIIQRSKALCGRLGIPVGNKPALALIAGYPAVHFRRSVQRRFTQLTTIGSWWLPALRRLVPADADLRS
jgi:hypothetical protein